MVLYNPKVQNVHLDLGHRKLETCHFDFVFILIITPAFLGRFTI